MTGFTRPQINSIVKKTTSQSDDLFGRYLGMALGYALQDKDMSKVYTILSSFEAYLRTFLVTKQTKKGNSSLF